MDAQPPVFSILGDPFTSILQQLPLEEIGRSMFVCKTWLALSQENVVWDLPGLVPSRFSGDLAPWVAPSSQRTLKQARAGLISCSFFKRSWQFWLRENSKIGLCKGFIDELGSQQALCMVHLGHSVLFRSTTKEELYLTSVVVREASLPRNEFILVATSNPEHASKILESLFAKPIPHSVVIGTVSTINAWIKTNPSAKIGLVFSFGTFLANLTLKLRDLQVVVNNQQDAEKLSLYYHHAPNFENPYLFEQLPIWYALVIATAFLSFLFFFLFSFL